MTISSPAGLTDQTIAETLIAGADAARPSTLGRFRTQLAVDNKFSVGFDPVTEADREAETRIREAIAARFPDHGIIGEEWDAKDTATRFNWIIDPIDGTRAFISGVPVWGTLIGLTYEGRAIAGLMEQPLRARLLRLLPSGVRPYRCGGRSRSQRRRYCPPYPHHRGGRRRRHHLGRRPRRTGRHLCRRRNPATARGSPQRPARRDAGIDAGMR